MSGLPTRSLGRHGPKVTGIGLGLMGLSVEAAYGKYGGEEERFEVLDRALAIGETFWDSSDVYGDSEDLLGRWFKKTGKRNEIFLATKFGITMNMKTYEMINNNKPAYVKEACAKSLERLGVDCIDLYYCHRLDLKTPIEKVVEAMVELKNEGKIKYLGLSEVSSQSLRRACAVHHIAAVQMEYSPFALDIESPQIALLQTCRELGVAVVAYSPLGRGFLTGVYKSPADFEEGDFRKVAPRFSEENFPKNLKLVEQLKEVAAKKQCTVGQLTLAWLMAQGEDIIPIPGTKKIKYLEENTAAAHVLITPEENIQIRTMVEAAEENGARYPEILAKELFADSPPLES